MADYGLHSSYASGFVSFSVRMVARESNYTVNLQSKFCSGDL